MDDEDRLGKLIGEEVISKTDPGNINKTAEYAERLIKVAKTAQQRKHLTALAASLGLAFDMRQAIKAGSTAPFPILLALAIVSDLADPIPIVGFFLNLIFIVATIFHGRLIFRAQAKLRRKIARLAFKRGFKVFSFLMLALDVVPFISLLPLNTAFIIVFWMKTSKIIEEQKIESSKITKEIGDLIDKMKSLRLPPVNASHEKQLIQNSLKQKITPVVKSKLQTAIDRKNS